MKQIRSSFLIPSIIFLITIAESLQAVPAFARQTGLDCMICHTQNQTKLGSFGRQFARSAYTMSTETGPQSLIDGEEIGLGIPMVLNMSAMLKARYDFSNNMTNGKGEILQTTTGEPIESNRGIYEVFKTSTINLAGRVANNVGTIIEFREKEGKAIVAGKVSTAYEAGSGYAGLSIFSTNNYGPFSGMENYNTGLYKPVRQFENHKATNAAQASDLASGAATGIQVYYGGKNLFLTVGAYIPVHNTNGIDIGKDFIGFARLAYEQPIGDLTLIVGLYGLSGTATASNTSIDPALSGLAPQRLVGITKDSYGIDMQLEGSVADVSLLLTANAVLQNKTTLSDASLMVYDAVVDKYDVYGEPEDADTEAYSVELAVYPWSTLGAKISYLTLDDRGPHTYQPDKIDAKDKEAVTVGFDYSFRQNIMFTMEYSMVNAKRIDIEDYNDLLSVLTISF